MSPMLILMIAALGPLIAVLDSDGSNTEETETTDDTPDDTVDPGVGDQMLTGTDEVDDVLAGGTGNDILSGLGGADTLSGGDGMDTIDGGEGNDEINGNQGADSLTGGAGDDLVGGGIGNDTLFGGDALGNLDASDNTLDGGDGNDELNIAGTGSASGGAGTDMFVLLNDGTDFGTITDYDATEDSIVVQVDEGETVTVDTQTVTTTGLDVVFSNGAVLTLTGVTEALEESEFSFVEAGPTTPPVDPDVTEFNDADGLSTTAALEVGANLVNMNDGDDTVSATGNTGADTINGGAGNDLLDGGAGADIINGDDGDDILNGTDGDVATGSDTDADTLDGGAGNDQLLMGDSDTGTGGTGNDTFIVAADVTGNVTLTDFDTAADTITVQTEDGTTFGSQAVNTDGDLVITLSNAATITLTGVDGTINENLISFEDPTPTVDPVVTEFNDADGNSTAAALEAGANLVNMNDGDDSVSSTDNVGDDTINGGTGADTLNGGGGNDIISGTGNGVATDDDADVLNGEVGDDQLIMGAGDTATGGTGADTFTLASDVTAGNITVTDFDEVEDMVLVQTETAGVTFTQDDSGADLLITLSTGQTITLTGVDGVIDASLITIEGPTATP
ncbi:MAG: calcium-binding protein [Ascidiaceihabitans sp.]|nr:calcium-binding protein [Ascidiaceihabitans sp.]